MLKLKPELHKNLDRIYAWYNGDIIDRAPINFSANTNDNNITEFDSKYIHKSQQERSVDVEYQIKRFKASLPTKEILGEGLPMFMPNLDPNVFASFYGGEIEFTEITSWTEHILKDGYRELKLDFNNKYLKKIDELTDYALSVCRDEFLVAYTDLHPGLDCVASFRGSENLS